MPRTTLTVLTLLAATTALPMSAGCVVERDPELTDVSVPSNSGLDRYVTARDNYLRIVATTPPAAYPSALRRGVLGPLEQAGVNDPKNPMFLAKRGDVLLALGRPEAARRLYEDALSVDQLWVAGWLGLGEVAATQGRVDDVERRADEADAALDRLEVEVRRLTDAAKPFEFNLRGLTLYRSQQARNTGPKLTKLDGVKVLIGMLQENENWDVSRRTLRPVTGTLGGNVTPESLFRRLRARAAYLRAVAAEQRRVPLDDQLAAFEAALAWDQNYWPARFAKAQVVRRQGKHADAWALLSPYVNQPRFANNVPMLLEAQRVFFDWFRATGSEVPEEKFYEYARKLQAFKVEHPETALMLAEVYRLRAERVAGTAAVGELHSAMEALEEADSRIGIYPLAPDQRVELRQRHDQTRARVAAGLRERG